MNYKVFVGFSWHAKPEQFIMRSPSNCNPKLQQLLIAFATNGYGSLEQLKKINCVCLLQDSI